MKNKVLITLFGVLFLILIFTIPTYAVEANVIFEKDANSSNKIKVILEVSEEQSVTKTNVVLDVKPSDRANLKNAEFAFSNEISSNSETAKWTYNNDKINLYVISKNELGNKIANGKKVIELGTLTVNTNNNKQTVVDISTANGGIILASVDHKTANITNDTSVSTQLKIGTTSSGDNNQGGEDNNPGNNPGTNPGDNSGNNQGTNPGGNNNGNNQNNSNNGGNQSSGNNNSGNRKPGNSSNNNNTNSVNNNEIGNENTNNVLDNTINDTNTIKNEITNNTKNTVQSSKDLPDTGEEEKSYMWVAIVVILILFITAGIVATRLTKNKKRKGNYRV